MLVLIGFPSRFLCSCYQAAVSGRPRTPCKSNMKRIALAFHDYHDRYSSFPPAFLADTNGRPMHSWRVLLLPFLGCQDLYDQYRFDEPWNGPHNRELAAQIGKIFHCPSDSGPSTDTSYVVVVGPKTVFPGRESVQIAQIIDGTSNTILDVEIANSGINWMEPRDLTFDEALRGINPKGGHGISSRHEAGANVCFCDGSVHYVPNGIDPQLLRDLLEFNDGHFIQIPY